MNTIKADGTTPSAFCFSSKLNLFFVMPPKVKTIASWVIAGLLTLIFVAAGTFKLTIKPDSEAAVNFVKYGLANAITALALIELTSAILFLIPRTSIIGAILLTGFMGGAICIHLAHGEQFLLQGFLIVLVWVVSYLRNPRVADNLFGNKV
jgi:uncharacterized membrane protein YphA (DoxX/SURF4 family)